MTAWIEELERLRKESGGDVPVVSLLAAWNALPRLLAAARLAEYLDEPENDDMVLGRVGWILLDAYREAVKASTPRPEDEGGGG